jgi:type II secretory pathway pseudopilin PulG
MTHAQPLPFVHPLLDIRRLLLLAAIVVAGFSILAVALIAGGTEKWVALGFKILELVAQMTLVAVFGGILVQAYVKWHSRETSMNEFRKATAEAAIREYFAVKRARRLLRANCLQGSGGDENCPWTEVPVATYDTYLGSLNDAQLGLEQIKRRLEFFSAVFWNPDDLANHANDMETYLGKLVREYERHRNAVSKRESIPLAELDELRGFITKDEVGTFSVFGTPFKALLELLEKERVLVAV